MKMVKTFMSKEEAELALSLLISGGIQCTLKSNDMGGMISDINKVMGGTSLWVEEKDFEDASAVLNSVV